ncbi:MAG: hypothetical protein R3E95_09990 [Thiolinea sp.]
MPAIPTDSGTIQTAYSDTKISQNFSEQLDMMPITPHFIQTGEKRS